MKRFYSHYTFIYPDTYLKNYVVELDEDNRIQHFFLFEKELANTEFYSGLLLFMRDENQFSKELLVEAKKQVCINSNSTLMLSDIKELKCRYWVYDENGILISAHSK